MRRITLFDRNPNSRRYAAGATIFTQGEPGDVIYVITRGQVDVLSDDELLATRGEGETIGEMALLDGRPRSATAVARTDCTLAPIDRRNFQFLLDYTPNFAAQLLRLLAERLRERLPGEPGEPGEPEAARPQPGQPADELPEEPSVGMHATLFAHWLTHPDGGLSGQWVTVTR